MKTLYLIDAYSYLYRAYHVAPPLLNPQNIPIGAVYIYTNMLLRLIERHKPEYGVICYDSHTPTLRKQAYPEYKGNRKPNPELAPQFALARDASQALGFSNIEAAGYEADDIIATLAGKAVEAGMAVVIVSPDKDLQQLVDDRRNIIVFDPMKDKLIDETGVWEKWGVKPKQILDLLALTGDVADNIAGVPGVGSKTAARMINDFGSLQGVFDNLDFIPGKACRASLQANIQQAKKAYELVKLYYDVPIHLEIEDMGVLFSKAKAKDFCELHDFKSLMSRI